MLGRLNRRGVILSGVAAATYACAPKSLKRQASSARVRGACHHDCPDTCAWLITTRDGEAVGLRGDPDNPYTAGKLCQKMDGFLTDVVYNPDRVVAPLKRTGPKGSGQFQRVSWDEALDAIAERSSATRAEHGGEAILPYSFAGTEGVVQGKIMDRRFFRALGASELDRTICGSTAAAGLSATLGTDAGIMPEDLEHARLILMWGGNPVVTNPHVMPVIERARRAGARLVVIDPLRSATAEIADLHLRPRPGTDAALAIAMMHVIHREGLHDADYVERYTVGFSQLQNRLAEYPPERAAEITGIPPEEIVALARDYATTRPSAIQTHIGMEKHRHGGMSFRAIACLPAMVGAWRERGGGLMAFTAELTYGALNPKLWGDKSKARTINMVELGRALTDLDPRVRVLFVYNSNPATIAPDQNRVRRGLERDDLFTVVIDHFVTDSALYADYVLPATTQAEHLDLLVPYATRYLHLNRPAIAPVGESLPNSEIFRRLAKRMGLTDPALNQSDEAIVRLALDSESPMLRGITFERLWEEGWAPIVLPEDRRPFAKGGFPTESGKCELYSEALAKQGLDPLPRYTPVSRPKDDETQHPLHFMSPKWSRQFVNSSHANQPRLLAAAGSPKLRLHPGDAKARGISAGDRVRVFNANGEILLAAEVTDAMQEGVVAMLHGWWASCIGGASANALTGSVLADLGGGSSLHDTWVQVVRA